MNAHMDVAVVEQAVRSLEQQGTQLAGAWRGSEAAITANEAGIGGDVLGQSFRQGYQEASTALRELAQRTPALLQEDSALGAQAVANYLAADQAGASAIGTVAHAAP
jgi:hypothetical protein